MAQDLTGSAIEMLQDLLAGIEAMADKPTIQIHDLGTWLDTVTKATAAPLKSSTSVPSLPCKGISLALPHRSAAWTKLVIRASRHRHWKSVLARTLLLLRS